MSEIDDYRTALAAARTAISAGSYSEARTQVALAQLSLAAIPDGGNDATQYRFRQNEIAAIEASIDKLESNATVSRNRPQYSKVVINAVSDP